MSALVPALSDVLACVLTGDRPARRPTWSRLVDAEDVAALRVILERGTGPVTRAEADLLFDIADAVAFAQNDPEWDDLFVGAVVHHLLGASGHAVRPRSEALAASAGLVPHPLVADAVAWLVARVRRDGRVTDAERVLLALAGADSQAARAGLAAVTLAA